MSEENRKKTVLVVDDEEDMRWLLANIIESEGFAVDQAANGQAAIDHLHNNVPDLVLLDIKMPVLDGIQTLQKIKQSHYPVPVIMLTAYGDIRSTVQAMKLGAYDYLTKPFENKTILFTIKRAVDYHSLQMEVENLRKQIHDQTSLVNLMGNSQQIQQISYQANQVAKTNFSVIIQGDTGTGKELVAHFIHSKSLRKDKPFVPVDCTAIPESLFESELFGYERGAFTGANQAKAGYFEMANGGTLFLDELANIPLGAQKKLLRVIQERCLYHLGGNRPIEVDVRIVAASNMPLDDEVTQGNFRRDLFHRLNEFTIYLPPLRERKEDIFFLAKKFLDETNSELGKKVNGFTPAAINKILENDWRGNVRELRNTIRRAVLLSPDMIEPQHLFQNQTSGNNNSGGMADPLLFSQTGASLHEIAQRTTEEVEKKVIENTLQSTKGNKVKAAKLLQVDYKTLYRKMKRYQLM
ncbi:MAG: sigma-54-dependent Fis family transcriptional regulator [Candidatus Schekmanbacteria bacterium]|nr:sigma-54-dependent Fis family transcriptional regulator [Candidatus Schekmanbacteria bacterium]